ncbi:hypothetical protein AQS8620_02739 [Aquimixticola soesokkakensis]|uniref:Pyridoxamine 5'-phosphate oxidase putative domain-containing protein n=1 Tax=Aquimixticola soesokkakensis TaxID=1519096 RepID=A0A1Y5TCI0_9RHOB|nr:pyridoxamine 5-phosphate oxidase [Aquimixticola soesokkakensis]SLN60617.1 hypothetical protein AQS8620_02739 [Aquimixticola soesokkakensis]
MTTRPENILRPTDSEARSLARRLLSHARFAALGVLVDGAPHVTRIGFGMTPDFTPLTLISDLALHTQALRTAPTCSLLIAEPPDKGDPLAFPRLTLSAVAEFAEKTDDLLAAWRSDHPKSALYLAFSDFHFVRFRPLSGALNGGFGKAFHLTADDLTQPVAPE